MSMKTRITRRQSMWKLRQINLEVGSGGGAPCGVTSLKQAPAAGVKGRDPLESRTSEPTRYPGSIPGTSLAGCLTASKMRRTAYQEQADHLRGFDSPALLMKKLEDGRVQCRARIVVEE